MSTPSSIYHPNPWQVETIQAFSFLNCPECSFKSKNEDFFQEHAVQCHPRSCVFFDEELFVKNVDNKESRNIVEVKIEQVQDKSETNNDLEMAVEEDQVENISVNTGKRRNLKFPCYYCDKTFHKIKDLQVRKKIYFFFFCYFL